MEQNAQSDTAKPDGTAAPPVPAEAPRPFAADSDDPWDLDARLRRLQDAYFAAVTLLEELNTELEAAQRAHSPVPVSREFLSFLWDNGSRLARDTERTVTRLRQELERIRRSQDAERAARDS